MRFAVIFASLFIVATAMPATLDSRPHLPRQEDEITDDPESLDTGSTDTESSSTETNISLSVPQLL